MSHSKGEEKKKYAPVFKRAFNKIKQNKKQHEKQKSNSAETGQHSTLPSETMEEPKTEVMI